MCTALARMTWNDRGSRANGFACWYPRMGGYVGMCVVQPGDGPEACFEAFVWHDGEFPFSGGETMAILHHCNAKQFVEFGNDVMEWFKP